MAALIPAVPMQHEIQADSRTVWVNGADGSNLGRFSRWGVDIHTTIAAQMNGAGQCLACTGGHTKMSDWRDFQHGMLEHHGVTVPDDAMPVFLSRP